MTDDVAKLPEVFIDLGLQENGVLVDGKHIGGIQSLKIEMDVEKLVPKVTMVFVARHVKAHLPKAEVVQEVPVVFEKSLTEEK